MSKMGATNVWGGGRRRTRFPQENAGMPGQQASTFWTKMFRQTKTATTLWHNQSLATAPSRHACALSAACGARAVLMHIFVDHGVASNINVVIEHKGSRPLTPGLIDLYDPPKNTNRASLELHLAGRRIPL